MATCIFTTYQGKICQSLPIKKLCVSHERTLNLILNKIEKRKQKLKFQFSDYYAMSRIDNGFEIASDRELNDLYNMIERRIKKSHL